LLGVQPALPAVARISMPRTVQTERGKFMWLDSRVGSWIAERN
jgi:hypothetical protein